MELGITQKVVWYLVIQKIIDPADSHYLPQIHTIVTYNILKFDLILIIIIIKCESAIQSNNEKIST